MKTHSGKFVLRISSNLHSLLRGRSEKEGASLNTLCSHILSSALEPSAMIPSSDYSEFVPKLFLNKLIESWGNKISAIILFGSYARKEETEYSDIDLLLVLRDPIELTRDLYREWDHFSKPFKLPIAPHFVKFPQNAEEASGIWYEVAIQGIILWQSDKNIFYFLQKLRENIANGKIKRYFSHGHPYWAKLHS